MINLMAMGFTVHPELWFLSKCTLSPSNF